MDAIVLIYITGAVCLASVYPALYNYATMVQEKDLKNKQLTGILIALFWPLFLLYVYIRAIRYLKFTK